MKCVTWWVTLLGCSVPCITSPVVVLAMANVSIVVVYEAQ